MSESAGDPAPPRVEVRLPGDRTVPGRLLAWRQDRNGQWWAEVTIHVPAASVQQVDGEDYTAVPRHPATRTPAAPQFVLTADTRPGQPRAAVLHKGDCWTLDDHATWINVTLVASTEQAHDALRFPDTSACTICNPTP